MDSVSEPNFIAHVYLEFGMDDGWERLVELIDSGFSSSKFVHLRAITISGRDTSSKVSSSYFPRLSSKGILSITNEKTTHRWCDEDGYEDDF